MLDRFDDDAYGLKMRTIQVAGIALLVLGMWMSSDVSVLAEGGKFATEKAHEQQKGDRLCQVRGYFDVDGRRLNFVDAIVTFASSWADRWDPYQIWCRLSHDPFTAAQIKNARSGKWVDLNFQTLPKGFPDDREKGEQRRPSSPYVALEIGSWPLGAPPQATCTNVGFLVSGFVSSAGGFRFSLSSNQLNRCDINLTATGLVVHAQTAGQRRHAEHNFAWDISVTGRTYDDPWPIKDPRKYDRR